MCFDCVFVDFFVGYCVCLYLLLSIGDVEDEVKVVDVDFMLLVNGCVVCNVVCIIVSILGGFFVV